MKIVDLARRELAPGDVVTLQEVKNHDFTVVKIEDNALTAAPGKNPVVMVQLQCNVIMQFENVGQAGVGIPVYLVIKAEKSQGNA